MSKAEEKAMQCCCTKCANNKLNCGLKLLSHGRDCIKCGNYIKGYQQAEKDLELSWEDLALMRLAFDATEDNINHGCLKISKMTKEYYQEVLKRFKNFKERKEK